MPVDAKLQAILDAGKALGKKPVELQTPAEARAERAEMVAQFVPMPEYAGVLVEDRGGDCGSGLSAKRRERTVAGGCVLSWRRVCGLYAGDA
jgi:hypothetical protein